MNTTHRKASRAKRKVYPLVNPIIYAIDSARAFTPAQVAQLMTPNHAAVNTLQFGGFDAHQWRVLADAFNIAEALAKPPINLANDHAEKFNDAQCVLFALSEQYRDSRTWTPRAAQLQTIKDAMEIFQIQLENVGQGEFERAVEKVKRQIQQALRGNGGNVRVVQVVT